MPKGASFERLLCKRLSEWWTDDRADDVLWRSQNSGARATTRSKAGLTLPGQYGDIAATDPIALPLTQLAVWELKRGYSTKTPFDVFDRAPPQAQQTWEGFFYKTLQTQAKAGVYAWAIISRRNNREGFIFMMQALADDLRLAGAWERRPYPSCHFYFEVRDKDKKNTLQCRAFGTSLDCFLAGVKPIHWREVHSLRVPQ